MRVGYSFGWGIYGQLGVGDTSDRHAPVEIMALKGKNIQQIACGAAHTIALTADGEIYTWGYGKNGRLGHGNEHSIATPQLVRALRGKKIRHVACGSYHSAAITGSEEFRFAERMSILSTVTNMGILLPFIESGELYTWGYNVSGELGHGDMAHLSTPRLVEAFTGQHVHQVACGRNHTIILLGNGDVYTCGDKKFGACGNGDIHGCLLVPRRVEELHGKHITQVAASSYQTAVLSESGELYTFGCGEDGRLGHNDSSCASQSVAKLVDALAGQRVIQVACGGYHMAAVTASGHVYTWGNGYYGQLGHGECLSSALPTRVASLLGKHIVHVACAWAYTVVLTDKCEIYTWGGGSHGKLGLYHSKDVCVPTEVQALKSQQIVSIAAYGSHTCIIVDSPSPLVPVQRPLLTGIEQRHALLNVEVPGLGLPVHSALHTVCNMTSYMVESKQLCDHVSQRLVQLFALLRSVNIDGMAFGISQYTQLIRHFHDFLQRYGRKNFVIRLISRRAVTDEILQFHQAIDNVVALLVGEDGDQTASLRLTGTQWAQDLESQMHLFEQQLSGGDVRKTRSVLENELPSHLLQVEALIILRFEISKKYARQYSSRELALLTMLDDHIVAFSKGKVLADPSFTYTPFSRRENLMVQKC